MRIRKWAADVFFDRNPVWNKISAGNLFETDAIWMHGLKIRRWGGMLQNWNRTSLIGMWRHTVFRECVRFRWAVSG
ncbi:Uncharacterised protein [Neisseria gonorrhoeae]|uniref:Uncharacterized protein n=1 Tax=Neisseria gonorrhoeae TaxID=485 RepID=A0A378VYL4_NEIGO|nr:Uncharacterised protein [Neisseria gonorrhoeae]